MNVRHFLRDDDISPAEQGEILRRAAEYKKDRFRAQPLAGPRSVALLFDKPSTRTRVSFTVGVSELGGTPVVLDAQTSQLSRGELVTDTARVLTRQCAAIVWRTFGQDRLTQAAEVSSVPVINALSDSFHPCQILADLLTLREALGELAGRILTFMGDTQSNMAHSYLLGGAMAGMHVRLTGPAAHAPAAEIVADANRIGRTTGGSASFMEAPQDGVTGADVLATDTWASMGQEDRTHERIAELTPYQLNAASLKLAKPDARVLHCLPAHREEEISAEVIDGAQSLVWEQAENRLHVQKALLDWLLETNRRP